MTPRGFPHSDILGSTVVCTYPRLFAACHVLHRLQVPRHSPCALNILIVCTIRGLFFRYAALKVRNAPPFHGDAQQGPEP
jgi:hypothetical protein